jgi:hypothetical protein
MENSAVAIRTIRTKVQKDPGLCIEEVVKD